MKRLIMVAFGAAVLSIVGAGSVLCANVAGSVTDTEGRPVSGAKILVKNMGNSALSEAHSNGSGRYQVGGLTPGTYQYILFPVSGFKGGDAVSYLGDKGLTIDWHVSGAAAAIAFASNGTGNNNSAGAMVAGDPYGFADEEYTAILAGSVALVGGGVAGGLAAAGEFSGSSSSPPASPSL
jgi:Carboxypeptidase regulatory-like domain